jgi:hypothetical protein
VEAVESPITIMRKAVAWTAAQVIAAKREIAATMRYDVFCKDLLAVIFLGCDVDARLFITSFLLPEV